MDLIYVSERKLYGRLGMRPSAVQQGVQASLKVPPLIEVSGNRTWEKAAEPVAPHALVNKAKRIVLRRFAPVPFTTRNLQVNQWITFDLAMSQTAVHEDSGRPPEDVALFAGKVADESTERPRNHRLMLCGSVQHLRAQVCAQGRMGSGTTWLHDLILEVERREEHGVHVIPESLNELMPQRRSDEPHRGRGRCSARLDRQRTSAVHSGTPAGACHRADGHRPPALGPSPCGGDAAVCRGRPRACGRAATTGPTLDHQARTHTLRLTPVRPAPGHKPACPREPGF